jgi:hypothetical protein
MKIVRAAARVTGAVLFSGAVGAADGAGNYAIWGAGGRSCNQFKVAQEDEAKLDAYRHYLMGYLTAFNALSPDTYDALGITLADAMSRLGDYCAQHRMDSFERAIAQLIVSRRDARTRQPPGTHRGWGTLSPPPSP